MIAKRSLPASVIVPVPDSIPIDVARNAIVAFAMRVDAKEAVCMLDSDIIPVYLTDKNGGYKLRYDAFYHLIRRLQESPVVSGVYFRRKKRIWFHVARIMLKEK